MSQLQYQNIQTYLDFIINTSHMVQIYYSSKEPCWKLAAEEAGRRAEQEYIENLRNDLQVEEMEERARQQEREQAAKKNAQRMELQAAKDY